MSLGLETENLNRFAEQFPQMIAIQITLDPGKRRHGKLPNKISLRPMTNDCDGVKNASYKARVLGID